MRILITRAEPEATALSNNLQTFGFETVIDPLLHIEYHDDFEIPASAIQAVIVTSKNALRPLLNAPAKPRLTQLPCFAVGQATAEFAKNLGFQTIYEASGRAAEIITIVKDHLNPGQGALLHLAGRDLAEDIKTPLERAGFQVEAPIVYQAEAATSLSSQTIQHINEGQLHAVIILSPRTGAIFTKLIQKHRLEEKVRSMLFFCLSDKIAKTVEPLGDISLQIAEKPQVSELISLINQQAAHLP